MRLLSPKAMVFGLAGLCVLSEPAVAQKAITIPAEPLKDAIEEYIRISGVDLIYSIDEVVGKRSHAVRGLNSEEALFSLLRGTGLIVTRAADGGIAIAQAIRSQGNHVDEVLESVLVTGSRIPGNDRFPPPVTILGYDELATTTPSNVPDALNKLPMFAPAQTSNSATSGANGRGFRPNGNFFDLRGLGPNRTLVLEDGRRIPATFFDGTVDANTLPQLLIQRVEIVTGGASAVYGSDAVTGVVNFVLDKSFDGMKAVLQSGISNYSDAKSIRVGAAGGHDLFENGHLLWSVEYYNRAAITDQAQRPYGNLGTSVVGNGTVTAPYTLIFDARRSTGSYGGVATSGLFQGQQFGVGGSLQLFNPGIPTTIAGIAIGGDGGIQHNEYLLPVISTFQSFARFDYALLPGVGAYLQGSYAFSRSYEANQAITNNALGYPLTIYSGNAFLRPEQQAALDATNTQYFTLNRVNDELSRKLAMQYHIASRVITFGLEGSFRQSFKWDAFYTRGSSETTLATPGNVNAQRLYAAIDAVRDPATDQIVCRTDLVAPGAYPGCVPFNPFGPTSPSTAAVKYVEGTTSWTAKNGLDDFGANVAGTLFEGPAGPIQVALGAEYRLQSLDLSTTAPDLVFNSQYLRVGGPAGDAVPASNLKWMKETQSPTKGVSSVYESDVEFTIPLIRNVPFIDKLELNGAYRFTNYSTSGEANTWKVAADWQITDEVRLRASQSRDIRAPTLYDLYQQPLTTNSGLNDTLTSASGTVNTVQLGNRDLKPEVASNLSAEVIYQPDWLPGLRLSTSYFHINLNNAIAMIQGSTPIVQNACLASGGTSPLCALIVRPFNITNTSPANFPTLLYAVKLNIARTYSEGIDLEGDYRAPIPIDVFGDAGVLNLRVFLTHQPILKTQTLPGTLITDAAGTAQTPVDRAAVSLGLQSGPFGINFLERVESSFRQSTNPTLIYDIPDVRPYFQSDLNINYDFMAGTAPLTGFVTIDNLFNAQGGLYQTPGYTGSPGMNYPVGPGADLIGRYFTIGVRLRPH